MNAASATQSIPLAKLAKETLRPARRPPRERTPQPPGQPPPREPATGVGTMPQGIDRATVENLIELMRTKGRAVSLDVAGAHLSARPAVLTDTLHDTDTVCASLLPVLSPVVGNIYLRPVTGCAPFVDAGQRIAAGQTLFLVKRLKDFDQITSPSCGLVRWICVEDGLPVEFGDVLLLYATQDTASKKEMIGRVRVGRRDGLVGGLATHEQCMSVHPGHIAVPWNTNGYGYLPSLYGADGRQ